MNGLGTLLGSSLRTDRVRLGVLVVLLGVMPILTASSYEDLYPTTTERLAFEETSRNSPSLLTLYGRVGDLTTMGGFAAWRVGTFLAVFTALVASFTVVRHTRAEEQSGRAELVTSAGAGSGAPATAALLLAGSAGTVVGVITAISLSRAGLEGALLYGTLTASAGWVGAGLGLVSAQVFSTARAANGCAAALVGLAYLARGVGDAENSWLSWVSPIGWFGLASPFGRDRWWILVLPVLTTATLIASAVALRRHRDLGAGLVARRPGRARASGLLGSVPALAWRQARGSVIGWCLGLGVAGLALGTLTDSMGDILAGNPRADDLLRQFGGTQGISAAYLGTLTGLFALVASVAGVQAAVHAHAEELGGHLELLLSAGGRRLGWYLGHLSLGLLGSAMALACAVVGTRLTAGSTAPDWSDVLATIPTQLPAVWLVTGAGFALVGALPRWTALSWVVPAACVVIWFTAPLLGLGPWFADLSPFSHLPAAPGAAVAASAVVVIGSLALACGAAGAAVATRRDLRQV